MSWKFGENHSWVRSVRGTPTRFMPACTKNLWKNLDSTGNDYKPRHRKNYRIQCTLHNLIHYYSILGAIWPQFNVPALLYATSNNNLKIGSTFYA